MAGRGRFNRRPTASTPSYRVNRQIKIPQIFLIDENDEKVGEIATDEARRRADAANLDLVEVAPQANPPVCRIMDFGKFKYAQRKKDRASGKRQSSGLKELRVRPAIDPHDLSYRLDQGRKFLLAGNKLQVVCIFRGRQRAFPELGEQVMRTVAESLGDLSKVESPPKMAGNRMTMMLARK
jgi:translation initiation factor IF-3